MLTLVVMVMGLVMGMVMVVVMVVMVLVPAPNPIWWPQSFVPIMRDTLTPALDVEGWVVEWWH